MSCNTDICGEWEDEQETPTGQCTPRRLKRTCDVAILYTNVAQSASDTCPDGLVGEVISVTVEAGTINNPFSVAAANAEALASAVAQVAALRAASPCLYPNTEQVCTETCPEGTVGDPITVTIEAGEYTAETQEAADALALAAACAQAAALRAETPCEEPELASISSECREKEGSCTGVTYTLGGQPFDGISISGTAVGCPDMFGNYAQATGSADVAGVTIVDGYPVFTFNNFQWTNTLQIFSLGCGISGTHPAKGPGIITAVNVTNTSNTDISATVNDLTMTSNPADNPYTASLTIIFDLVGTEVQMLPTTEIDLSLLVTDACWSDVEGDETEWASASCSEDTAYVEQDGEDFSYSILQTRYVLGVESPLVIGQNYRITTVFSRRAVGTADPFVVIEEDDVLEFEADATTDTTDWFTIPNEVGFETKIDSYTIEEI